MPIPSKSTPAQPSQPSLAKKVEDAISDALSVLEKSVKVTATTAKTHRVIAVTGWNNSEANRKAIAHYLVGLRVCAINMAFKIRADLTDTAIARTEVVGNVEAVVGVNGRGLKKEVVERNRNPWIAEGIWHLCFTLSKRIPAVHPAGRLVALSLPHIDATDHGIDVAALYQDGKNFGISIVESKAYPDHPNGAIQDAVKFYRGVDNEVFSLKIRQSIQLMRGHVPKKAQKDISEELWRQTRCYMPNPHYDAAHVINWDNTRSSFKGLAVKAEHIFVMPHAVDAFDTFFDAIALEMVAFAKTL